MSDTVLYHGYYTMVNRTHRGRTHEVCLATNAVTILMYDPINRRVILIQQPRAAMVRPDNPDGIIVETVAGRFDCDLDPVSLAIKEAQEESGVTLRPDQVQVLNSCQMMADCPGLTSQRSYLCYAEITPDQIGADQETFSAAGENEQIRRLSISVDDLPNYVCEDIHVFALVQWLLRKLDQEATNEHLPWA